jgi:ATP-dependent exoDNAse (exonuclease V) beta subunit
VALTRARDRLYLASEVKDGRWRAFGGSLGDILPAGIKARFEAASAGPSLSTTEWTAASGRVHSFRLCTAESPPVDMPAVSPGIQSGTEARPRDNFATLVDPLEVPRQAVTRALSPASIQRRRNRIDTRSRSLTGTLVHRLFERFSMSLATSDANRIETELERLIRDEEIAEAGDVQRVFGQARDAYIALCGHARFAAAVGAGDVLFEVPFSARPASSRAILRGTFDCLVKRRDGGVTVLELKTGRRAPEHAQQLEIYVAAARAMFPGTLVEGELVYAEPENLDDRALHSQR